jgi:hypothetical protein
MALSPNYQTFLNTITQRNIPLCHYMINTNPHLLPFFAIADEVPMYIPNLLHYSLQKMPHHPVQSER